jgi:DNA gyrase subunit A
VKNFGLSEIQAQAILDMQLKRLTGLERKKIEDELAMLKETIAYLEGLLKNILKILGIIKEEVLYLKKKYGDERKTKVIKSRPGEITDEQLIENKEVIVVMTKEGYIKQVPRETFRVQQRGGKGVSGIETKETDNVYFITTAMAHDYVLFFSNQGRVFRTRVWDIPQGSRTQKERQLLILSLPRPRKKSPQFSLFRRHRTANQQYIIMFTKNGR